MFWRMPFAANSRIVASSGNPSFCRSLSRSPGRNTGPVDAVRDHARIDNCRPEHGSLDFVHQPARRGGDPEAALTVYRRLFAPVLGRTIERQRRFGSTGRGIRRIRFASACRRMSARNGRLSIQASCSVMTTGALAEIAGNARRSKIAAMKIVGMNDVGTPRTLLENLPRSGRPDIVAAVATSPTTPAASDSPQNRRQRPGVWPRRQATDCPVDGRLNHCPDRPTGSRSRPR